LTKNKNYKTIYNINININKKINFNKGEEVMRVYTIQPREVWEALQKEHILHVNTEYALKSGFLDKDCKQAYDWLSKKMIEKGLKAPEDVEYPWWCWAIYDWENQPPEDDEWYDGKDYVEIEMEIPENEILLSDHGAWHSVLNNRYLDDSKSEKEWKEINEWFDSLPNKKQAELVVNSWDEIFNIEKFENDWCSNGRFVQGTFWELKLEQVVNVKSL